MEKEFEYNGLKIGDEVNFVLGTSMMTGVITKFYFSSYNVEECSVKTKFKTYPHIELRRCKKVKIDDTIIDAQKKFAIEELNNVLLVIDDIDKFDTVSGDDVIEYIRERIRELKGE